MTQDTGAKIFENFYIYIIVYYESMKRKLISNLYMSVGVMEDYKLRDLRASHTLGG